MPRKIALVIGNTDYVDPGLSRLATPKGDVEALSTVLKHPDAGEFDEVKTLVNPSAAIARKEIARLYAQRSFDDLVLLYFSGHGVLDEHGELHLACNDTERDVVGATGVPARFVSEQMDRSASKRAVLILDCCHSGAFARGSKGATGATVGTKTAFEGNGQGRVVLTATDATQYAFEGDQVTGEAYHSVFTKHLLHGMVSGEADRDGDGYISIDELYDYVQEKVLGETNRQSPLKWSLGQKGAMMVAKNPSPRAAELPPEIQELMLATQTSAREAAVRDLGKLLHDPDRRRVLAAKMALEKLTGDDSRRVSDAARAALAAAPVPQQIPIVQLKTGPAPLPAPGPTFPPAFSVPTGAAYTAQPAPWQPPPPAHPQYGAPQQAPQTGPWVGPPPPPPGAGPQGQQAWNQAPGAAQWQRPPIGPPPPTEKWLLVLLAIFVPPLGMYLRERKTDVHFWVNIGLCVVGFVTFGLFALVAIGHALWYVLRNLPVAPPPRV